MSDPQLQFDPRSGVPALRQITDNLRVMLVEGTIPPGTVLPSVRQIAEQLGVHFNTVAEAYRLLADEGWLRVRHGRQAVVVERTVGEPPNQFWSDEFRTRVRALIAQTRTAGAPAADIASELREIAKSLR